MTGPRHALVLATQCDSMQPLPMLEEAARGLYSALTDPDLGGCVAALRDDEAMFVGRLSAAAIIGHLNAALDHARDRGAVLVVALLGHGFVVGSTTNLYLMAAESVEDDPRSAVDVSHWFGIAVNGALPGLIGIVDTCSSAGALPERQWLLGGQREGRTRLALLTAAGVGRAAFDLRMTMRLTALMRAGLPGGPERFDVQAARSWLKIGSVVELNGDPFHTGPLWLSHNRATWSAPLRTHRRSGPQRLRLALTAVPDGPPAPGKWSRLELAAVGRQLDAMPDSPEVHRAAQLADCLGVALGTEQFLREWLPDGLSTHRLRRAAAAASAMPGAADGGPELLDLLEGLALAYPQAEFSCRPQIARFVAALGSDAGKDLAALAGSPWAQQIGLTHVNDAVEWATQRSSSARLRLVVSLHASLNGSWPEVVEAWLLLDGQVHTKLRLPCAAKDRAGVELAIARAADEAEREAAALGLPLQRVDVAVPTHLLPGWRPERVKRGEWLGVRFDVVTRWSERLSPPEDMHWILGTARARLMNTRAGTAPIGWLGGGEAGDLADLEERLAGGAFDAAVVVDARPVELARLLPLLLAHVPIVLWADGAKPVDPACRDALDRCWPRMPAELLDAYRRQWRREPAAVIADLRAVWDDLEWLAFCTTYQGGEST
jgi:hypothetical protein